MPLLSQHWITLSLPGSLGAQMAADDQHLWCPPACQRCPAPTVSRDAHTMIAERDTSIQKWRCNIRAAEKH